MGIISDVFPPVYTGHQKIMEKASSARVTGIPAVWPEAWGGAGYMQGGGSRSQATVQAIVATSPLA